MGGMEDAPQKQLGAVGQAQMAAGAAAAVRPLSTARARPLALDLKLMEHRQEEEEEDDDEMMSSEARRARRTAEFCRVEGLVGRLSGLMREVKELSAGTTVENGRLLEAKMEEVEDRLEQIKRLVLDMAEAWIPAEVRMVLRTFLTRTKVTIIAVMTMMVMMILMMTTILIRIRIKIIAMALMMMMTIDKDKDKNVIDHCNDNGDG
jgi:hypothetical protein